MSYYIFNSLALFFSVLSSIIFYLGSPNQQWLCKRFLGFYPMLAISLFLLIPAYCFFRFNLSALSSFFSIFTVLMFTLGILPFLSRYNKPQEDIKTKTKNFLKDNKTREYKLRWSLRIIPALILAYLLAIATSGLFAYWSPGSITQGIKTQLVMWMIVPLWLVPLSLIFFIHSVSKTIYGLLGLNAIAYMLLWFARTGV